MNYNVDKLNRILNLSKGAQGTPYVYKTNVGYGISFEGAKWIKTRECKPHHLIDELSSFIGLWCDSVYMRESLPGHDITQRVNYHKLVARAVQCCFDLIKHLGAEPKYSKGYIHRCMETQRFYIKRGEM